MKGPWCFQWRCTSTSSSMRACSSVVLSMRSLGGGVLYSRTYLGWEKVWGKLEEGGELSIVRAQVERGRLAQPHIPVVKNSLGAMRGEF